MQNFEEFSNFFPKFIFDKLLEESFYKFEAWNFLKL